MSRDEIPQVPVLPNSETDEIAVAERKGKPIDPDQSKLKKNCSSLKGTWSIHEQIQYVEFLRINRDLFTSQESRKVGKVFQSMSKIISTRTSVQCKTHHQKMRVKFGHNFYKVIRGLLKKQLPKTSEGRAYLSWLWEEVPQDLITIARELRKLNKAKYASEARVRMHKNENGQCLKISIVNDLIDRY